MALRSQRSRRRTWAKSKLLPALGKVNQIPELLITLFATEIFLRPFWSIFTINKLLIDLLYKGTGGMTIWDLTPAVHAISNCICVWSDLWMQVIDRYKRHSVSHKISKFLFRSWLFKSTSTHSIIYRIQVPSFSMFKCWHLVVIFHFQSWSSSSYLLLIHFVGFVSYFKKNYSL